jgi:hypothetical protein
MTPPNDTTAEDAIAALARLLIEDAEEKIAGDSTAST